MREKERDWEEDREKKKVKGHGDADYVQDDKPCWNVTVVTTFNKKKQKTEQNKNNPRTCNMARL